MAGDQTELSSSAVALAGAVAGNLVFLASLMFVPVVLQIVARSMRERNATPEQASRALAITLAFSLLAPAAALATTTSAVGVGAAVFGLLGTFAGYAAGRWGAVPYQPEGRPPTEGRGDQRPEDKEHQPPYLQ